jgi:DNA polymerase elongation subunit (family B)
MTLIYCDIETLPTTDPEVIADFESKVKAPATYKKPESIAQWMSENLQAETDAAHRKTALDGAFGRVFVIGYAIDDEPPKAVCEVFERDTLQKFADIINGMDCDKYTTQIVGHNVSAFDLRFLVQRYMINRIRPPYIIQWAAQAKPWEGEKVYDTMVQWAGVGNRISLDKLCMAFEIESPKSEITGANVYDYYLAGKTDEIIEYCLGDVIATRKVADRMRYFGAAV